jgi:hypothetical protein
MVTRRVDPWPGAKFAMRMLARSTTPRKNHHLDERHSGRRGGGPDPGVCGPGLGGRRMDMLRAD